MFTGPLYFFAIFCNHVAVSSELTSFQDRPFWSLLSCHLAKPHVFSPVPRRCVAQRGGNDHVPTTGLG